MRDEHDLADSKCCAIVKSNKERITIRLDPDIIDWFRGRVRGGGNYLTLINEALGEQIERQRGADVESVLPGVSAAELTAIGSANRTDTPRSPCGNGLLQGQALLAAVPIGMLLTDSEGTCVEINRAALELLGRHYEAAVGEHIDQLLGQPIALGLAGQPSDPAAGRTAVRRVRPPTGKELTVELSASLSTWDGKPGVVYVVRDISDELALAQQLRERALRDPLTGLPNRDVVEDSIDLALRAIARGAAPAVLCFLDLDDFKEVNDTCGHAAGDALLRLFASVVSGRSRATDTIGRVGGDEFVVLLNGCALGDAVSYVEQVRERLRCLDFHWHGRRFDVGLSAGLTPLTPKTPSVASALREADMACLEAKAAGRGRTRVFYGGPFSEAGHVSADADLLHALRAALASGAIPLSEQPLRDLRSPERSYPVGQVLVAFNDPDGNPVAPPRLLGIASRYGLASALDRSVVRRVLDVLANRGPARRRRLYVNLTPSSMLDDAFAGWLEQNLAAPVAPFFGIGISESGVLRHPEPARRLVAVLRSLGCGVAVDQVSGAVEALSSIIRLPVTLLKLDPAFARMTAAGDSTYIAAEALVRIAHQAGVPVAITHIETSAALRCAEQLGVDFAQGTAVSPVGPLIDTPPTMGSDADRVPTPGD